MREALLTGLFLCLGAVAQTTPITVTEPNGAETYVLGDTMHVRWEADTTTPMVMIEISVDGGEEWYGVATSGISIFDPEWGHYTWVVPDTVRAATTKASTVSGNCLIRVRNYVDQVTNDISDQAFSILLEAPPVDLGDIVDDGCGCGAGTEAALLPPLVFWAFRGRRRTKKPAA